MMNTGSCYKPDRGFVWTDLGTAIEEDGYRTRTNVYFSCYSLTRQQFNLAQRVYDLFVPDSVQPPGEQTFCYFLRILLFINYLRDISIIEPHDDDDDLEWEKEELDDIHALVTLWFLRIRREYCL